MCQINRILLYYNKHSHSESIPSMCKGNSEDIHIGRQCKAPPIYQYTNIHTQIFGLSCKQFSTHTFENKYKYCNSSYQIPGLYHLDISFAYITYINEAHLHTKCGSLNGYIFVSGNLLVYNTQILINNQRSHNSQNA